MAYRAPRELVFCYECENEWHRSEHGLQCPLCRSEFVEVIEAGQDPRDQRVDGAINHDSEANIDQLPPHPLHNMHPFHTHNPWANEGVHHHDGDGVTHVEWNAGPGLHFSRTSYRSISPNARRGQGANDPFAPFFQSFSTILEGAAGFQRQNGNRNNGPNSPFPPSPFHQPLQHASAPSSPLQDGPARQGFARGRSTPGSPRPHPHERQSRPPHDLPVDNLQGLLGTLIRGMQDMHNTPGGPHNNPGAPGFPPLQLFANLMNPANARHGDAVYSEEALDRIITQFMEAQNGHTAPGPASAEAIAQLPKRKVDEPMMGSDGKAECSVCMDNVSLGDEVTVLPCSHWFHEACVGAWLKEHDTCPHCRQGIMPKEGQQGASDAPRQPHQEPRHSQPPLSPPNGNNGFHFAWHAGPPPASPSSNLQPPHGYESRIRRRSAPREARRNSEGSSSGGGLTGWVRSHFGGGSGHHE